LSLVNRGPLIYFAGVSRCEVGSNVLLFRVVAALPCSAMFVVLSWQAQCCLAVTCYHAVLAMATAIQGW
jgi:hypothetical protein